MRSLRIMAVALLLLVGAGASAQTIGSMRLGVIGGFTSSDSNADIFKTSSYSLYHAGVTFECPIAGGFAIQPSILYQVKGATLNNVYDFDGGLVPHIPVGLDTKVGYVEVPVQIQWGPDLLAFRPYVFAEPFVGFGVNTSGRFSIEDISLEDVNDFRNAAIQRLEYGVAAGLGFEFSRFQISGRYFWNMGSLYNETGAVNPVVQAVRMAYNDNRHFNGFSISAAVFF